MATPLTDGEREDLLARLDDWRYEDSSLVKDYDFGSFVEAFAFLSRVALLAEKRDHHPEIRNVYGSVALKLRTHDAGDEVTAKDAELAEAIDGLFRRPQSSPG